MLLERTDQTGANFLTCLNLMKLNIYSYIRCKSMTVCLILFLFSLYGLLCISDWELCKMPSEICTENNKFDSYMCDGSSKNYKPTKLQIYITLLSAVVVIWTTHFNIEISLYFCTECINFFIQFSQFIAIISLNLNNQFD